MCTSANKLLWPPSILSLRFFFFNDTATTEIYTLSLHDALPIYPRRCCPSGRRPWRNLCRPRTDRKSTRLNSSHLVISYAVFCLKKNRDDNDIFYFYTNLTLIICYLLYLTLH